MKRLYVQLCRNGDLIGILPILFADSLAGNRPAIMVQQDFCGLFTGVSYADVVPFTGHMHDLGSAVEEAKKLSDDVRCLQVIADTESVQALTYGPAGLTGASTDSFAKEPFKITGRTDLLRTQPRPVFDRRDKKREALLLRKLKIGKPENTVFVALGGVTSPFPYKPLLMKLLKLRFRGRMAVYDLSQVRAEQLYDFIGVFERAKCLVTSDSALLHLAYAVPTLPVVALVQDQPHLWNGSPWRTNHICHIRYGDFAARAVEMLDAIDMIGAQGNYFAKSLLQGQRILHVWNGYELGEENYERHVRAQATWQREYYNDCWIQTKVELGAIGRDSKHSGLKDTGRYPFLNDAIRLACYRSASDADILCLTRLDTCFTDDLTQKLVQSRLPAWSHRMWRNGTGDIYHPFVDLFAFTVGWWKEHRKECPDLVLGRDPYWNRILLDLCKRHGGVELKGACYVPKYELQSAAESPPRQRYNENHFAEYEKKHGLVVVIPKVTEQLPTITVNRHALAPYAYNPSLVRWRNRWLMAYRYHNQNDLSTALAIAELDENLNVKATQAVQLPPRGGSEEDPKLFIFGKNLCLSYVDSTYPLIPPQAVVRYGKLTEDAAWVLQDMQQPKLPGNDGLSCQKNYVFFEFQGRLFCIYQCFPKHLVFEISGDGVGCEHASPGLRWPFGEPRGGTAPVPYKGKLLRFFHSSLDNEPAPYRRRYSIGAMLIEPEPPFAPVAISTEPVIRGSEADDLSAQEVAACLHYKRKVVFPGSATERDGGWLIAHGVNDASCALTMVMEKDLKL